MGSVLDSYRAMFSPRLRFFLFAVGLNNAILVGRDLLVAYLWGTSLPLDQFQAALIVPVMIMTVFSFVMSGAFLPAYMKVKRDTPQELSTFGNRILSSSQVLFAVLFVVSLLIHHGPHALTLSIYGLLFSLCTVPRMILIAEGRDRAVLVAPIISLIVGLAVLIGLYPKFGIHALGAAYVTFVSVEFAVLILAVRRDLFGLTPFALWLYPREMSILQGQMGYLTAASIFMAVSITIEQKIALSFGAGALPHYNYATKICSMLAAIGGVAVKNYLFPRISEAVTAQDMGLAMRRTRAYVLRYLFLLTPVCLLLAGLSTPLTALLFERGAFTAADTAVVGSIQAILFLQIPTFFATLISVQALLAARQAKMVMYSYLTNAVLRVGGSYLFSAMMGLAGIALGVSIAQLISALLTYWMAMRFVREGVEASSEPAPEKVQDAS